MKLEKCYDKIGANYKDLVTRLGSEDFANLFAKKFLTDESYTSAKDTTCAEIGICSPNKPSGYPLPSYLS